MFDHDRALPGQDTLIACWSALARSSLGAEVLRFPDSVAAVFPHWTPLNNAIARRGSDLHARDEALRLARIYDAAGVDTWAFWWPAPTTTFDAHDSVQLAGLARDTTTVVMTAALDASLREDARAVMTSVASAVRAGDAPVPASALDAPAHVGGSTGWVVVEEGQAVSGLWTYRHGDDCGIYGVGTAPEWRRRGLARALVEHVLARGARQGASTASLQSTHMGLPLYASLGFVAVGRYEEWLVTSDARSEQRGIAQ